MIDKDMPEDPFLVTPHIDATVPHSARIWNYWLGGKDNYEVDTTMGDKIAQMIPGIVDAARADRAFLGRAVHAMLAAGVRQFLDIGTGLPTVDNTHEVAQRVDPTCKIVYVDNDPLVLVHARALLTGTEEGACAYIAADVRDPHRILAQAAETLDFTRPVGLMMLGILNHILDDVQARAIVKQLVGALAPGSYLAVAHPTAEIHGDRMHQAMQEFMEAGGTPIKARPPDQIAQFFQGLELEEPGIVSCSRWRPEVDTANNPWGEPDEVSQFCGLGRKAGPR